jgi:hypothetical protein
VVEAEEQALVQEFVAHLAVEALDVAVLHGVALPLTFQLYSVASLIPCLRARSPVFAPASCSRSTAMICSSVNRFRFTCPSFKRGRTLTPGGGKTQWQVNDLLPWAYIATPPIKAVA